LIPNFAKFTKNLAKISFFKLVNLKEMIEYLKLYFALKKVKLGFINHQKFNAKSAKRTFGLRLF